MNIKTKTKIITVKNVIIIVLVLVFSFYSFRFVSAYPIEKRLNTYRDVLPSPGDFNFNDIINLNLQGLFHESLKKTFEDLPSFNLFRIRSPNLPLEEGFESPDASFGSFNLNLRDFLDTSSLNTSDFGGAIKAVVVLGLRLLLVALMTIAQVLKVLIEVLGKGF